MGNNRKNALNNKDLMQTVAARSFFTQKAVSIILREASIYINERLEAGDTVTLRNIGSFEVHDGMGTYRPTTPLVYKTRKKRPMGRPPKNKPSGS